MNFPEIYFILGKVQPTVTSFQMYFVDSLKHSQQVLKRTRKSISNLFDMNLPKKRSSQKIYLFERLIVFKYGIWAQRILLSKNYFNSEIIKYRV